MAPAPRPRPFPPDHSQACRDNPDLISYYLPTGYRRTPLDTCQGGRELEFVASKEMSCGGHEGDFDDIQRSKGLSGFWFFILVICLPIALAGSVGWWVYRIGMGSLDALGWGREEGGQDLTRSSRGLSIR